MKQKSQEFSTDNSMSMACTFQSRYKYITTHPKTHPNVMLMSNEHTTGLQQLVGKINIAMPNTTANTLIRDTRTKI